MITDLGGFVASCYQRGIRFVNVPTTLLAMVDAAIGGKNGVDFGGCKNQIGTFAEPLEVMVSPVLLSTLPDRELPSKRETGLFLISDTPSDMLSRASPITRLVR